MQVQPTYIDFKRLPGFIPWLVHGAVWLFYIVFIIYVNTYQGTDFVIGHPGIHIFAQAAVFYVNYLYLIPAMLARRRVLVFAGLNLGLGIFLVIVSLPVFDLLRHWRLGEEYFPPPLSYSEQFWLRFFELLFVVLIACVVRFSVDWFGFQQAARNFENAQLRSELAFLRSQLNPHFLFNTLNALYALAIRKAPETSDGIMQLSQLMRYILYEANDGRVRLSREVEMIENLLELQRLRLPLGFPLNFEVKGQLDQVMIEPLLLVPLIENMFKHGTGFMSIVLTVGTTNLILSTENGIAPKAIGPKGGIGLENLRKQLLHLYPGRHELIVTSDPHFFRTKLTLPIDHEN
jgi:two-component system, LytTR family, sensor kinase